MKYFTIFLLLLLSIQLLGQKNKIGLKKIDRFYSYGWLPEFKDSISIIVDESKINQRKKYCVVTKTKKRNYNLYCWTGELALETPTEWKDKLKIRFKGNNAFLKFGKKRIIYQIHEISKEKFLLVKLE